MNDRLIADLDGWGLHWRGTRQDCNLENVACVSTVRFNKTQSGFMNPISGLSCATVSSAAIRHGIKKRSVCNIRLQHCTSGVKKVELFIPAEITKY